MIQNDIVHGNIELNGIYEKMVTCSEFTRLQDIIQTANSTIQYPELEKETRYEHSIGTYFLMSKAVNAIEKKLSAYGIQISSKEKELVKMAALLHDIGHGANSHLLEEITGESHEQRSINIVKDKTTQIHQMIAAEYGEGFVEELAEFMGIIYGNQEPESSIQIEEHTISLKSILATLISNDVDVDRMDFLMREGTYTKMGTLIKPDEIFKSFEISVIGKQLVLGYPEEKKYLLEQCIFERTRNYDNIYFNPIDFIANHAFETLLKELRRHPEEVPDSIPETIRRFLTQEKASFTNQEYMQITDTPLQEAIAQIGRTSQNKKIRYLCNYRKNAKEDYQIIKTDKSESYMQYLLSKAIPGFVATATEAFFRKTKKIKPYKGGTTMLTDDGIKDFAEVQHYANIHPISKTVTAINPKIVAFEMGLLPEEFEYEKRRTLQEAIYMLSRPKEVFELRYIISKNDFYYEDILEALSDKFEIVDKAKYHSTDEYYDTPDYKLLNSRDTLRVRTGSTIHKGEETYLFKKNRISYKTYSDKEEADYTTRKKVEEIGNSVEINDYSEFLQSIGKNVNELQPTLRVINFRRLITLKVNGHLVDFSFNMASYGDTAFEMPGMVNTIEINPRENEVIGRLDLLAIQEVIESTFPTIKKMRSNANIYEIAMVESYEKYQKGYINSEETKEFEQKNPEIMQRLKEIMSKIKQRKGVEFLNYIKPLPKQSEIEFNPTGDEGIEF